MKRQVKTVNRMRPKFVIAVGKFSDETRRIITKTSETINMVIADGSEFFTFWVQGSQNIVIVGDLFINPQNDLQRAEEQQAMIAQELEQSKMCQHHTYVYTDIDPRLLPESFKAKCLASRVNAIIGVSSNGDATETDFLYKKPEGYVEEEGNDDNDGDDDKPKIEDMDDENSSSDSDLDMAQEDDAVRVICGFADQGSDKLLTFQLDEEMQFGVGFNTLLK